MVHCQLPKQRQRRRILMYLVYLRYLFKDNANSKVYSTSMIKPKREIYYPIMKTNWLKIIKWNRARDCCNKEFYYMFLIIWMSNLITYRHCHHHIWVEMRKIQFYSLLLSIFDPLCNTQQAKEPRRRHKKIVFFYYLSVQSFNVTSSTE